MLRYGVCETSGVVSKLITECVPVRQVSADQLLVVLVVSGCCLTREVHRMMV